MIRALFLSTLLALSSPAWAAELSGVVADSSNAVLPTASVSLLNVATGQETVVRTDAAGRYRFANLPIGIYRVVASSTGFSEISRTIVVAAESEKRTENFSLAVGSLKTEVTVSADRGARDLQVVPLRADTLGADALRELAPVSVGDALVSAPGVTPVGSGPFQVRPRLRGLDSTRVLVLVDGERLNNARTATDRAGVEVGLVDPDAVEQVEVLGGAGSVLYGTDALSGTINIITNQARLTEQATMTAGFDGFYSSNEDGRRGTIRLGMSTSRFAVSFMGGAEKFGDYRAGGDFAESSVSLHTSGVLNQEDTIDDNFGFTFGSFPDPFNAPFTRTSNLIANSGMSGTSANVAAVARLTATQTIEGKFQRRRSENVGFPDFAQPTFFQGISLPWSQLDKTSATYTASAIAPWFSQFKATAYVQRHDRMLQNQVPVQFPVPGPRFFPINVFRLDILSQTRQQVTTPGLDLQATFTDSARNVITAGITILADRSEDERTTTTTTSQIGVVALGARGPAATVFAPPVVQGPAAVSNPVRVPNARFRDIGVFVHDEWTASPNLRVTGGLRVDRYQVRTENTPGYEIESLVSGATPAIDRSTLPNIAGDEVSRSAFTGEIGVVYGAERPVSVFSHYVRSYRHPNLEELLFSGPATAGNIVPNIAVKPETGHNVDLGTRLRFSRFNGSVSYFNNTYRNFISTEIVAALGTSDSVSQAINLARVRIQGVEFEGTAPFIVGGLALTPRADVAYNRGTVLEGRTPFDGTSLAGAPQDNITPWKGTVSLRVGDVADRWWSSYSVRSQARVSRVSPLLEDSQFLIAQDLFALDGFAVHRIAAGYTWRQGAQRVGATLSIDNLTDKFYREHFQFAPARGRSVSFAITIRGGR